MLDDRLRRDVDEELRHEARGDDLAIAAGNVPGVIELEDRVEPTIGAPTPADVDDRIVVEH